MRATFKTLVAMLAAGLLAATLMAVASPSAEATGSCTGDPYTTPRLAKDNFESDCGRPFEETPDFRCDWVPDGWECTGPAGSGGGTSPTTATTSAPTGGCTDGRGGIYPTSRLAKDNYENDCGRPFEETPDFRCDWVTGGWQCTGPVGGGTPTPDCTARETLRDGIIAIGVPNPEMDAFDNAIVNTLRDAASPATTASLAVMRDGRLIHSRTYTLPGSPVSDPESVFRIASISKPITAAAIMTLVDRGELRLDDRVSDHIQWGDPANPRLDDADIVPWLARRGIDPRLDDITIEQLLRHQAGWTRGRANIVLRHDEVADALLMRPEDLEPDDYIGYLERWDLNRDPGTATEYANFGYMLLGEIIEEVTGQPYETYVQRSVFRPLGIDNAHLARSARRDSHRDEVLYQDDLDGTQAYDFYRLEPLAAVGGWVMSANDVARFGHLTTHNRVLPSAGSLIEMRTPTPGTSQGLGWGVDNTVTPPHTSHTGGLPGTASALRNRSEGISWAVVTNGRGGASVGAQLDRRLQTAFAVTTAWPTQDLTPFCG